MKIFLKKQARKRNHFKQFFIMPYLCYIKHHNDKIVNVYVTDFILVRK